MVEMNVKKEIQNKVVEQIDTEIPQTEFDSPTIRKPDRRKKWIVAGVSVGAVLALTVSAALVGNWALFGRSGGFQSYFLPGLRFLQTEIQADFGLFEQPSIKVNYGHTIWFSEIMRTPEQNGVYDAEQKTRLSLSRVVVYLNDEEEGSVRREYSKTLFAQEGTLEYFLVDQESSCAANSFVDHIDAEELATSIQWGRQYESPECFLITYRIRLESLDGSLLRWKVDGFDHKYTYIENDFLYIPKVNYYVVNLGKPRLFLYGQLNEGDFYKSLRNKSEKI